MAHGMDTGVGLVLFGQVDQFRERLPGARAKPVNLHDPTPELVDELAVAFAAHDRAVEKMIDVAPSELIAALRTRLQELQQWSEAARITAANTTVGTFHYQTYNGITCDGPAEWLTITWDGAMWTDQTGQRGHYALGMFVTTNASDLRAKTRAIPPHIVDRAVAFATAFLER